MLLRRRYRKPSPWSDFAWLVGIIEGEGCVRHSRDGGYHRFLLSVSMTDRDIIERLVKISGVGKVRGPIVRALSKDKWEWRITGEKSLPILTSIRPYMSRKKGREIDLAFALYGGERVKAQQSRREDAKRRREEAQARTHCVNGHLYTDENTYFTKQGQRICRNCRRLADKKQWARKKERKGTTCD